MGRTKPSVMESEDLSWVEDGPYYEATEDEVKDFSVLHNNLIKYTAYPTEAIRVIAPASYNPTTKNLAQLLPLRIYNQATQHIAKVKDGFFTLVKDSDEVNKLRAKIKTIGEMRRFHGKPKGLSTADLTELELTAWREVRKKGAKKTPQQLAVYCSDEEKTLMPSISDQITLRNIPSVLNDIHTYQKNPHGLTIPLLYIGGWLSFFVPHVEDDDAGAICYNHRGEPKVWYTLEPDQARMFEDMVDHDLKGIKITHHKCKAIFREKLLLLDINKFKNYNLRLKRHVQRENQFMILPPMAYHFGFNCGFNIAESVNFCMKEWIPYGLLAKRCQLKEKVIDMEFFVYNYMFERYSDYLHGRLYIAHPSDPTGALQLVDPPTLTIHSNSNNYLVTDNGIDRILAVKTVNSVQYIFAVVNGERMWMERAQAEKMRWNISRTPVKIPDNFFSPTRKEPPPVLFDAFQETTREVNLPTLVATPGSTKSITNTTNNELSVYGCTRNSKKRKLHSDEECQMIGQPTLLNALNENLFLKTNASGFCSFCGKDLSTILAQKNRNRHVRDCEIKANSEQKYKCLYCSITFTRKHAMKIHSDSCKSKQD